MWTRIRIHEFVSLFEQVSICNDIKLAFKLLHVSLNNRDESILSCSITLTMCTRTVSISLYPGPGGVRFILIKSHDCNHTYTSCHRLRKRTLPLNLRVHSDFPLQGHDRAIEFAHDQPPEPCVRHGERQRKVSLKSIL